jgi:hypothetical protein
VSGVLWLIITGSGLDDWIYWHFFTIIPSHNQWLPKTRSILTGLRLSSLIYSLPATVTDLILIYELLTSAPWMNFEWRMTNDEGRRTNHLRMNSFLVLFSTATPPVRMNCPVRSHVSSLYNLEKDRIEITTPNSSSITVCFLVAVETCLATRYPATDVLLLLRP